MKNNVQKILIELNQSCNLNCEYCFYNDIGRSENSLNIEDIKSICDKYPNASEFYLTGGECTLNDSFDKIYKYLSEKGDVILFTNGLYFDKISNDSLVEILPYFNKIIITYDSEDKNYVLRKNLENRVLEAINNITSLNNEKLEVKICSNKYNLFNFEDTIKTLVKEGVKNISINYIKNITSSNKNFELNDQEVEGTFLLMDKYKEYFHEKNLSFMKEGYTKRFKNNVSCIAGDKFIYIDSSGTEYYCPSSNKLICDKKSTNCFGKHCINLWEMFI